MATKIWKLSLDGVDHVVELQHGYFSGTRVILLDGKVVGEGKRFVDFGSTHPFRIGEHICAVFIRTNGITFTYDLTLDGSQVGAGKNIPVQIPVPATRKTLGWILCITGLLIEGCLAFFAISLAATGGRTEVGRIELTLLLVFGFVLAIVGAVLATRRKVVSLETEFTQVLERSMEAAKTRNYLPTTLVKMLGELGGVQTAKKLLAETEPQTGLYELWNLGILHESMEAVICDTPRFHVLFTPAELAEARRRLDELGYFK